VEIHYARDTLVEVDGQRTTTAPLAVGQVVEVIAGGTGSEVLAQHISVSHLVSGPITRIDAQRNAIEVIGQPVQLSPATRAGDIDGEYSAVATAFRLNSYVQVSGMRRADGVVMASRVTGSEARELVQLTGAVTRLESGTLTIAGTRVRTDDRVQPSIGDEVRVIGRWDGSAILAQAIEPIPRVPFDGRVRRIDIEGYVRRAAAGQLQVGPFLVELPPAAAPDALQPPDPNARIRIEAVVRDRQVIIEHVGVIGDLPTLPPVPDGGLRGGKGGGPGNVGHQGAGASSPDQSGQDERAGPGFQPRNHCMMMPAQPDVGDVAPPSVPIGPIVRQRRNYPTARSVRNLHRAPSGRLYPNVLLAPSGRRCAGGCSQAWCSRSEFL
jgi:hypothetical protein